MTLTEILIKELKEWPEGAEFAYQFHSNNCITFERSQEPCWVQNYYSRYTADERGVRVRVTREEYLAAKEAASGTEETNIEPFIFPTYEHIRQYLTLITRFLEDDTRLDKVYRDDFIAYCRRMEYQLESQYEHRQIIDEMMTHMDPHLELSYEQLESIRLFCWNLYCAGYTKNEED